MRTGHLATSTSCVTYASPALKHSSVPLPSWNAVACCDLSSRSLWLQLEMVLLWLQLFAEFDYPEVCVCQIGTHVFFSLQLFDKFDRPSQSLWLALRYSLLHITARWQNLTIPESLIRIGNHAFAYCSSFTSLTMPESVTQIEDGTFLDCCSLTNLTIPESVTQIEDGTFHDCSSLTNLTMPESVTQIEDGVVRDCSSLTSLTIQKSVTKIEHSWPIARILIFFRVPSRLNDVTEKMLGLRIGFTLGTQVRSAALRVIRWL